MLHSADSICQTLYRQSKNGSERTRLCAPKVTQEVHFPKQLWGFLCTRVIVVVHLYSSFFNAVLDGARAKRQIPDRIFGHYFYQFEEGQRRQVCVDLDVVFSFCSRILCALQCSNRFVVPSVGGATRFANLLRRFSTTQKNRQQSCVKYFVQLLFTL